MSYCAKIKQLHGFLLNCLIIISSLAFSYTLYDGIFTVILRIKSYPSCTSLAEKLTDHIHHLTLSSRNGTILMLLYHIFWLALVMPPCSLYWILHSMLEGYINLYYETGSISRRNLLYTRSRLSELQVFESIISD